MNINNVKSKYLQYGAYSTLFIVVILGFITVFNYFSTLWFARLDLTEQQQYSVSASTKKTLRGLDDVVNFKVFFSKKLPAQMIPTTTRIKDILDEYKAYSKGKIRIKYLDPADDPKIEEEARYLGIQPVRMDAIEKGERQILMGYLGIAILYGNKKELLPLVSDVSDLEYNLTSALKKIVRSAPISVGIIKDNGTIPLDSTCKSFYDELNKQYQVVNIDVRQGQVIEPTIKAIILASPENISERSKFEIDQYLMKGGRLLAFIDGATLRSEMGLFANPRSHGMNDVLASYGVRVNEDLVLDRSCGVASFQTQMPGGYASMFTVPYPFWPKFVAGGLNPDNIIVNKINGLMFPWASSLELLIDSTKAGAIKPIVLARTTKYGWNQVGNFNLDPQSQLNAPKTMTTSYPMAIILAGKFNSFYANKSIPKFKREITGKDGTTTRTVDTLTDADLGRSILTQSTESRILVTGSSRFITDQFVQQTQGANVIFALNAVDWMAQDDDLISIRSRKSVDNPVKILTPAQKSIVQYSNAILMPILVIIFGIARMMIRRKKMSGN